MRARAVFEAVCGHFSFHKSDNKNILWHSVVLVRLVTMLLLTDASNGWSNGSGRHALRYVVLKCDGNFVPQEPGVPPEQGMQEHDMPRVHFTNL